MPRSNKAPPSPLVAPLGTVTHGPRTATSFVSRPIALPGRTVRLDCGSCHLVVRVRDREDGVSHGDVLETIMLPARLKETGLERWRRALREGFDVDQVL